MIKLVILIKISEFGSKIGLLVFLTRCFMPVFFKFRTPKLIRCRMWSQQMHKRPFSDPPTFRVPPPLAPPCVTMSSLLPLLMTSVPSTPTFQMRESKSQVQNPMLGLQHLREPTCDHLLHPGFRT